MFGLRYLAIFHMEAFRPSQALHPFQLGAPLLQCFEPRHIVRSHRPILAAPPLIPQMSYLQVPHHSSRQNVLCQQPVRLTELANNLLLCMSGPFHLHLRTNQRHFIVDISKGPIFGSICVLQKTKRKSIAFFTVSFLLCNQYLQYLVRGFGQVIWLSSEQFVVGPISPRNSNRFNIVLASSTYVSLTIFDHQESEITTNLRI